MKSKLREEFRQREKEMDNIEQILGTIYFPNIYGAQRPLQIILSVSIEGLFKI